MAHHHPAAPRRFHHDVHPGPTISQCPLPSVIQRIESVVQMGGACVVRVSVCFEDDDKNDKCPTVRQHTMTWLQRAPTSTYQAMHNDSECPRPGYGQWCWVYCYSEDYEAEEVKEPQGWRGSDPVDIDIRNLVTF